MKLCLIISTLLNIYKVTLNCLLFTVQELSVKLNWIAGSICHGRLTVLTGQVSELHHDGPKVTAPVCRPPPEGIHSFLASLCLTATAHGKERVQTAFLLPNSAPLTCQPLSMLKIMQQWSKLIESLGPESRCKQLLYVRQVSLMTKTFPLIATSVSSKSRFIY